MTIECNDERSNVLNLSVKITVVFNNAEKPEALKINRRYFDYCFVVFTCTTSLGL